MNVDYSPDSVFVFIDEFATPDLEVPKVGNEPLFVYAAVVIKAVDIAKARTILNTLYDNYYRSRYIKSKHLGNDEKEEKLLQLADFYAGTIGKYYCGHYDTNRADVIHNTFMKSRLSIEWFPREYTSLIAASASFDGGFDIELLKIATETATDFVESSDDTVGCELVSYLLQESYRNPNRYISSKEIKANLMSRGIEIGDPINKISELRDKGVLIISPIGKKGYKFPTSELEIAEFFNRLSGNVVPQLRRGFIMNKLFREKSVGRIDVLGKPEFDLLRSLGERSTDSRNSN